MGGGGTAVHVGDVIGGRYRIERHIATGGMGVVYEATELNLDRRVALKTIHPRFAHDAEAVERLQREARAAAALAHPNIVQVTDFYSEADVTFLVMEYLEGWALRRELRSGRSMSAARICNIAAQVLSGLGAAHRIDVVHRDVTPNNILLLPLPGGYEVAKLLDFGVVKLKEDSDYLRLTMTGVLIGTPRYMAPEQIAGEPVDGRTDLYALGVVMYRALSGVLPFEQVSMRDLTDAIVFTPPPPLESTAAHVDPKLTRVVERALEKDPAKRFQTAEEMVEALSPWVASASAPPPATGHAIELPQDPPTRNIRPPEAAGEHTRRVSREPTRKGRMDEDE